MLSLLHIENVAVIEKTDIVFYDGFHVLTGETGAGKSIIIDAINMVLGERTSRDIIRKGKEKAYVCATFVDLSDQVLQYFDSQGVCPDEDGNMILEREIYKNGRGICKVNGRPVSTTVLKGLAVSLINIHGQHDSQSLLHSESHIGYLDAYIGSEQLLEEYRPLYEHLKEVEGRLKELTQNEMDRERKLDLLRYQAEEIQRADLTEGEDEELTARRDVLINSERIHQSVEESYALLYDGGDDFQSAHDLISQAYDAVRNVAQYDENLQKCEKALENITYALDDAVEYLRDAREGIEYSEGELDDIENRLALISRLKRKYGADVAEILQYLAQVEKQLDELDHSQYHLQQLREEHQRASHAVEDKARQLHEFRLERARLLAEQIEEELHFLNMENASFEVRIEKHTDCEGNPIYRPSGCDDVEFLIRTNKGEDFKPLVKIASGGELSRIMLALKNIMTKGDFVGTLIFDEIDTGISGRAASRVAHKMKEIAALKQVLCVSHLVALAARADHHYLISKDGSEHTRTSVTELEGEARVQEIARLIGGEEITETTLANAREILAGG